MNRNVQLALSACLVVVMYAALLGAHHAGSNYDNQNTITLEGTVTSYEFINPHVRIIFEVKDDKGKVESWVAESGPPQMMYRAGWNRNTLKVGERITVTGAPARDGSKRLGVKKLVGSQGQTLGIGAG